MDETRRTAAPQEAASAGPTGGTSTGSGTLTEEELAKFTDALQKYKTAKNKTDNRVISAEKWWKLRNSEEESDNAMMAKDDEFRSASAWLHNVIVSKHADATEAYPEPNILPREPSDREEANRLSKIIPCVLEQNGFEETYSSASWSKLKTGTGIYKVTWDSSKLNGLGDISIEPVSVLNVFWEPGKAHIQDSRYFFHTELTDKEVLAEQYPDLADKLNGGQFMASEFPLDDQIDKTGKLTVVDAYYHRRREDGKKVLHYCKYVGNTILYSSENDGGQYADGYYAHGMYPFVFDPLYPIEGSPCGYGYVDICRNPQTTIDLINSAVVKNCQVGATPRFFIRGDGNVNEKEFLDLTKPFVHVGGNLAEDAIREIPFSGLDSVYLSLLDRVIQELRETSGNTETSNGNISSGVTAASAIAALQEASGKGSRDASMSAYRSYAKIINMVIELIRQFYDMPRQFRITGEQGQEQFTQYDNRGLQPQYQGNDFGQDMGYRLPVFDIKVVPQKRNFYTKVTQNELALQFYQLGFFNPARLPEARLCLDMMDFDGKDEIVQRVMAFGSVDQKMAQYMQLALELARGYRPDMVPGLTNDINQTLGGRAPAGGGAPMQLMGGKAPAPAPQPGTPTPQEGTRMQNARAASQMAAQPEM